MRLAGQIQRDLLPDPLPQIEGAGIHTLYRPADRVSGDLYDVARLDACHVALSFADATGHGLPAALLTMLARRALQATPGGNGRDALRRPQDVLAELNREILGADLSQCQFLSGLYAVYDENSGALCWARGGSPYPILVRHGLPPQQLVSEGMLLGVDEQACFEHAELSLAPGDVVVFHTDGLDALLLHEDGRRVYDDLSQTPWYRALSSVPIAEQLSAIAGWVDETPSDAWPVDDLTVLALEVT
jgi:sigma-B regulation protein RsbU (phosphoserine phosphatase)